MGDGRAPAARGSGPVLIERVARRHKIFEQTEVVSGDGQVRAHVLDISVDGALVYAQPAPEPGARIVIRLAAWPIDAVVRWRDGGRFGIAFARSLRETELGRLLD